jgi:SAM-dependent methyltransferase
LRLVTSRADVTSFVEWGGQAWERQVAAGMDWLGAVDGLRLLEIGTRFGGMAIWFAIHGAHVTALDVTDVTFADARRRAESEGVADRIEFLTYSGRPHDLPVGFDVIFSKSTLVLMGDMSVVAGAMASSLIPGGRLLAVENARGPLPVHVARAVRRRTWRPYGADYFTSATLNALRSHFDVELERWTSYPPTVLIGARARRPLQA